MILIHESESQKDQFDEKNEGQKSRDSVPLKDSLTRFSHYRISCRVPIWPFTNKFIFHIVIKISEIFECERSQKKL